MEGLLVGVLAASHDFSGGIFAVCLQRRSCAGNGPVKQPPGHSLGVVGPQQGSSFWLGMATCSGSRVQGCPAFDVWVLRACLFLLWCYREHAFVVYEAHATKPQPSYKTAHT